jgi:hypothetical protein
LADKPAGAFLTGIPDANGDFQIQNVYPGPYQILPECPRRSIISTHSDRRPRCPRVRR